MPADSSSSSPTGQTYRVDAAQTNSSSSASPFWRTMFRLVPALDSLRGYSFGTFRADLLAGLTVAAVAVPQAMAYASIFGVPVQYGLYTAIVMTAVGALFDSSKQLINGPTNAISIAMLSALAAIPADQRLSAAILMALLIGSIQIGITLFRLGDLSRYVSHSVIVGFTLGAGMLLVLDQLKNFLGLKAVGGHDDHFLVRFWLTMTQGGPVQGWTLLLSIGAVATVLLLRWLSRVLRMRLPDLLLAVIGAAFVVWAFNLDAKGVKVVGTIPRSLPTFQMPAVQWTLVRDLSGSAAAIGLLGLLEAIAMAKAIAAHTRQKLDINQQCLSEGVANLTGSFFQCFPGSGSLTRTAINHQAGALTQWSGVFSAAAVALTMFAFAPLAQYIPRAALAGILILSAWRMVDWKRLRYHLSATRFDALIVLSTALSAVAVSVEFCILIGTTLSFLFYVPRAARVLMTELTITPERVIRERFPNDPRCDRMRLYDVEGELFFGAAPDFEEHLERIERETAEGVRVVLLRVKRVRNPDAVCLHLLDEFLIRMEQRGIVLLLCGVRLDVFEVLTSSGIEARLGSDRILRESQELWTSTFEAVRQGYKLLDRDLCSECPRRNEDLSRADGWNYVI